MSVCGQVSGSPSVCQLRRVASASASFSPKEICTNKVFSFYRTWPILGFFCIRFLLLIPVLTAAGGPVLLFSYSYALSSPRSLRFSLLFVRCFWVFSSLFFSLMFFFCFRLNFNFFFVYWIVTFLVTFGIILCVIQCFFRFAQLDYLILFFFYIPTRGCVAYVFLFDYVSFVCYFCFDFQSDSVYWEYEMLCLFCICLLQKRKNKMENQMRAFKKFLGITR